VELELDVAVSLVLLQLTAANATTTISGNNFFISNSI
jgi:hypothetical protein